MAAFHRVFGTPIDEALWTRADPLAWAERADPNATPALYLDCGAQDRYGLARGHRALDRTLNERGVAHILELPPGDHGYDFVRIHTAERWDAEEVLHPLLHERDPRRPADQDDFRDLRLSQADFLERLAAADERLLDVRFDDLLERLPVDRFLDVKRIAILVGNKR